MATTENVTVLFTDLVGSTELSSSLSPDAADELRRAHFAALREPIAATQGREVKTMGDGLMVAFDATVPALSCAVTMQQAIERHNRKSPVVLAIRIGLSSGDVTVEDGDYFGDPVVEAARLCAVAQGGQVLTTDIVKGLARRSGHSFITERELELKGLPEPVIAWEVVWELAEDDEQGASRIPLPPRLPPAPGIGLVGRTIELERLGEIMKAAGTGEPAPMVLISGEAGVGKSTLTSWFARDAHRDGAVVLYGRCVEDLAIAHRPFVEALDHYLTHAQDSDLSALGTERLSILRTLAPELRIRRPDLPAVTASDPDAERWLLYGAVVAVLERASVTATVVLIVDDLHWADRPTLQLLRHLATNLSGRVLLLGSYRETDLSASSPLTETLASLTREPSVARVSLAGFDDDEVVSFVQAASGHMLDEAGVALAHALYQETDGNPFFVAEVLRHLVETRAIVQDEDGTWVPTRELSQAGLPDSVRQVIGSRVRRLGDEATRVLSAASVLGQEFDVDLLTSVVRSAEDPILDVLDAAGSSALVIEVRGMPGRFRFSHALIQRTLYDDLSGVRRSRLHRAAAEALEDRLRDPLGSGAGELARHWLAATGPTETSKAAGYARLAGESALESLAPTNAIRWFQEALGVVTQSPDDGLKATCLAGLGEAQRQIGDPEYRETLLEAARLASRIGDVPILVRAALANNRGFQSSAGTLDAERVEVLVDALDKVGEDDSPESCQLLALLALERTYDGDYLGRRALADRALAMARRLNDPKTLFDVLIRRWQPVWIADTVEEVWATTEEAESLADMLHDPIAQFWAALTRSVFAVQVGNINEVKRCHGKARQIASQVGQPILIWTSTFNDAWASLLAGNIEQAETLASDALRVGSASGEPDCFAHYTVQLHSIRWHQGRQTEFLDALLQMAKDNPGLSPTRAAAARGLIEAGRDAEARAFLEDDLSAGFSCPKDFLEPAYLDGWARVASELGHEGAARMLYDRLRHWPKLVVFGGPTALGAVSHHLGTLATVLRRYDDAEVHFSHALRLHEKLQAPFFVALTELEWGRMLMARGGDGDQARAHSMVRVARDRADQYGFGAVSTGARQSLSTM